MNVEVDRLTQEVNRVLGEFSQDVDEAVQKATEEVGTLAVFRLRNSSPVRAGGSAAYARGWKLKKTTGNKHYYKVVVHNTQYQLTHLLEYGHDIVRSGKVVGHANAQPHIAEVEKWVQDNIEGYIQGFLDKK